jgi:peptidoglycan LD-endopeptidase CwlK
VGTKNQSGIEGVFGGGRPTETLGRFDKRSEGSILTLHLRTQTLARRFLRCVHDAGFEVRIISGTRSYAEQSKLYAQGHHGNPGPIVTEADGGQSNHNFGIAWDIGVFKGTEYKPESPNYGKVAKLALAAAELQGLEWDGNWRKLKDQPHYEIGNGLPIEEVRRRFEAGTAYI